jgi:hypothetical protein
MRCSPSLFPICIPIYCVLSCSALQLSLIHHTSTTMYQQLTFPLSSPSPSTSHSSLAVFSSSSAAAAASTIVVGVDINSLADWSRLLGRMRESNARRRNETSTQLLTVQSEAHTCLTSALPRLATALNSYWTQPAQYCIPHLRNRLGFNIDDYAKMIRTILTASNVQEQRYIRHLKQKLTQQL